MLDGFPGKLRAIGRIRIFLYIASSLLVPVPKQLNGF